MKRASASTHARDDDDDDDDDLDGDARDDARDGDAPGRRSTRDDDGATRRRGRATRARRGSPRSTRARSARLDARVVARPRRATPTTRTRASASGADASGENAAIVNTVKAIFGAGGFALPWAFARGGIALVGTCMAASLVFALEALRMLIKSQDALVARGRGDGERGGDVRGADERGDGASGRRGVSSDERADVLRDHGELFNLHRGDDEGGGARARGERVRGVADDGDHARRSSGRS